MRGKAALLAGIALIGAAIGVDATNPAERPVPPRIQVPGAAGVLACPAALPPAGRALLHLANVGETEGRARVKLVPDRGTAVVLPVVMPASSTVSVRLHGRVKGSGAVFVEYQGSIIASHTAWLSDGAFGGSCAPGDARRLVLAHGSTAGATIVLAVANPGAADADVSVGLLVGGQRMQPETLRRFIVRSHRRRTFLLADFAFEARDVTTVVQADAGRVVAASLMESAYGSALITGGPASSNAVTLVGLGDGTRAISIAAIGQDEDAAIDARVLEPGRQGKAPGVPPALAPADSVRLAEVDADDAGPLAYTARVTAGSPVAAAGSWRRGRGDRAGLESVEPSARWAGVIGLDPVGQARVLLANPGDEAASVHLTIIGAEGIQDAEVAVPPGRTASRVLGSGRGTFAVIADSDQPVAVALDAIVRGSTRLVAVPGVPLLVPSAVAVRQDPQAGVPGRRPGT